MFRAFEGGDSRVAENGQYASVAGCMGFSEGRRCFVGGVGGCKWYEEAAEERL